MTYSPFYPSDYQDHWGRAFAYFRNAALWASRILSDAAAGGESKLWRRRWVLSDVCNGDVELDLAIRDLIAANPEIAFTSEWA